MVVDELFDRVARVLFGTVDVPNRNLRQVFEDAFYDQSGRDVEYIHATIKDFDDTIAHLYALNDIQQSYASKAEFEADKAKDILASILSVEVCGAWKPPYHTMDRKEALRYRNVFEQVVTNTAVKAIEKLNTTDVPAPAEFQSFLADSGRVSRSTLAIVDSEGNHVVNATAVSGRVVTVAHPFAARISQVDEAGKPIQNAWKGLFLVGPATARRELFELVPCCHSITGDNKYDLISWPASGELCAKTLKKKEAKTGIKKGTAAVHSVRNPDGKQGHEIMKISPCIVVANDDNILTVKYGPGDRPEPGFCGSPIIVGGRLAGVHISAVTVGELVLGQSISAEKLLETVFCSRPRTQGSPPPSSGRAD